MLKQFFDRSRRGMIYAAIVAATALTLLTPRSAQAWWGPGWGWGWHARVAVALPPVVVAPPYAYPASYYGYNSPYRWVPPHYTAAGVFVPGHWVR